MRGALLLLLAGGCGGQTGEMDNHRKEETRETPLALDEMSPLGFTAQEVLDRAPTTTYDGALQETEGEFGPGSMSDQLLQSSPFTVAALASPVAVYQEFVVDGVVTERWVVIRGDSAVTSADGVFDASGRLVLQASGLSDAEIGWNYVPGSGPTGTVPSWVDEEVARWQDSSSCPDSRAAAIVTPHGPLDSLWLLLNIVNDDPDCSYSGNVAALDLEPVE